MNKINKTKRNKEDKWKERDILGNKNRKNRKYIKEKTKNINESKRINRYDK